MSKRKFESMIRRLKTMQACGLGSACKVCRNHAKYIASTLREEMQPKKARRKP